MKLSEIPSGPRTHDPQHGPCLRESLAPAGASSPSLIPSSYQHPELHTYEIHVKQLDTGLEYEDTIDTFLNVDSRSLPKDAGRGPSNYDFTIFKRQLTEALEYDHESDKIIYTHALKGEVEVDLDWKWRVALKHLSTQPGGQGILNFAIRQKNNQPNVSDRVTTEASQSPKPPSSPAFTTLPPVNTPGTASEGEPQPSPKHGGAGPSSGDDPNDADRDTTSAPRSPAPAPPSTVSEGDPQPSPKRGGAHPSSGDHTTVRDHDTAEISRSPTTPPTTTVSEGDPQLPPK